MYYYVAAFTVNKMPCEGKTGKYHINVTELYLLVFVWLVFFTKCFFSSESQAIMHYFFRKCPAPFTPTAWGNCATEGTRQSLKHAKACGSDTVFLRQVWVKFILCTTSSGFISCQAQTCRVSHVLLAASQKQAESKSILQPHLLASSGQSRLERSWGKQSCWNSQCTERRCDFFEGGSKAFPVLKACLHW